MKLYLVALLLVAAPMFVGSKLFAVARHQTVAQTLFADR